MGCLGAVYVSCGGGNLQNVHHAILASHLKDERPKECNTEGTGSAERQGTTSVTGKQPTLEESDNVKLAVGIGRRAAEMVQQVLWTPYHFIGTAL